MASAPQDLSEVYLLEKRKGEIEEVNIIPNGKRRCVAAPGPRAAPPPRGRSPPPQGRSPPRPKQKTPTPTPPPPVSAVRVSLESYMARGALQYADIILVRGKHFQPTSKRQEKCADGYSINTAQSNAPSTRMLFCKASKLSMLLVFMRSLRLLTLALLASLLDLVPKYFVFLAARPSG